MVATSSEASSFRPALSNRRARARASRALAEANAYRAASALAAYANAPITTGSETRSVGGGTGVGSEGILVWARAELNAAA